MYDDGKVKAQTLRIIVKGKLASGITNKFTLTVNVLAELSTTISSSSLTITMPAIFIQIAPGNSVNFESTDIQAVTKNPYALINTDSLVQYLKLENKVLVVAPKSALDQGEIKVYLMAVDDQNRKVTQEVNIVVNYGSNATGGRNRTIVAKEFTARIVEISKTGLVYIRFTDQMKNLTNISLINNQTLKLSIRTKDKELKAEQPDYTWTTTEYRGNYLKIQLKFTDPVSIS